MWPVIRRTSVPPTEMSKDHRPHHTLPPAALHAPHTRRWERHNPSPTPLVAGTQLHSLSRPAPHRVECRAGGTVVA
jgi:hypothetical protein